MPLPFIILGGLGLGVAVLVREILKSDSDKDLHKKNRLKLGIIGMQESGKTRFLCHLRNVPFVEKNTAKTKYEEFVYTTKSGKQITLEEGVDIGGGKDFRDQYKKIIQENNMIFYFFDIEKYLKDNQYKRECNSRFAIMLEDITSIQSKKREEWESCLGNNKKLVIFATHKDKTKLDDDNIKINFKKVIQHSWYRGLEDKLFPINTTDNKELKEVCNEIFK